jgi:plastocyanin
VAAAVVLLLAASGTHAGQRRVTVGFGGGTSFSPDSPTLNTGDHVTFVWASGGHTATNGTDTDPLNDPEYAQIFDSGFLNGPNNAFTWKCDEVSNVPYLCTPHFPFMTGTLQVSASGVLVSSFRITEVQYNAALGQDLIEIANLGGDFGDLGRYRIAVNGTTSHIIPTNSIGVLSGSNPGRVVIHTNQTGTNTATDIFLNTIGDLPATGSVALYVPNTTSSLVDPDQIIDFVQWGAGNQANSATAVLAGIWPSAAEFVPAVPVAGNYDITFCGVESERGASHWEVAHPNFRTQSLCATPTQASSWGRIKVLYR